jgi:hypothetical protein
MAYSLLKLRESDIPVGQPLQWAVYDTTRRLTLAKGQVIASNDDARKLVDRGAYRASSAPDKPASPGGDEKSAAQGAGSRAVERSTFESMRLAPGETLQLQNGANGDRYVVRLIGFVPDSSILITTPAQDGYVLLFREGQGFVVRAFSGTQAFGFTAAIRRVCNVPYPYLHLEYPSVIEGVTVRSNPRVRVRTICSLSRPGESAAPTAALITDLSATGARIDCGQAFAAVDEIAQITFRMRLKDDDAHFSLDALVRSVRTEPGPDKESQTVVHGVEFIETPSNERLLLKTVVYSLLADGGAGRGMERG